MVPTRNERGAVCTLPGSGLLHCARTSRCLIQATLPMRVDLLFRLGAGVWDASTADVLERRRRRPERRDVGGYVITWNHAPATRLSAPLAAIETRAADRRRSTELISLTAPRRN